MLDDEVRRINTRSDLEPKEEIDDLVKVERVSVLQLEARESQGANHQQGDEPHDSNLSISPSIFGHDDEEPFIAIEGRSESSVASNEFSDENESIDIEDQSESSMSSAQHWSDDSEASTSSTESHVSESIRSDYSDGGGTIGRTPLPSEINRTYPINISEVVEGSVIRYDSESDEYHPIDQAQEQLDGNPVMEAQANIEEIPRTRAQAIDVHRQVSRFMDLLYYRGFRYPRNALDDVIRRREANEWQANQQRIQRRLNDNDHDANEYIIHVRQDLRERNVENNVLLHEFHDRAAQPVFEQYQNGQAYQHIFSRESGFDLAVNEQMANDSHLYNYDYNYGMGMYQYDQNAPNMGMYYVDQNYMMENNFGAQLPMYYEPMDLGARGSSVIIEDITGREEEYMRLNGLQVEAGPEILQQQEPPQQQQRPSVIQYAQPRQVPIIQLGGGRGDAGDVPQLSDREPSLDKRRHTEAYDHWEEAAVDLDTSIRRDTPLPSPALTRRRAMKKWMNLDM
ncbi:hypothetical protein QAD02_002616 [Eretmocerus hayati]|uniref:Uncharacterized protein n=1 Tax=Eretmocerus hayati TaxID=131215 RepID=A0ACC2NJU6_9HYME|nr:hypothetical protein QAD02_002616 [Eretmocerus hayati]